MKTYKLLFLYGYNPYVITTKDDELVSVIERELKMGALL